MTLQDKRNAEARRQLERQRRTAAGENERDHFYLFNHHVERRPASLGKYADGFSTEMTKLRNEVVKPFLTKRHHIRTSARFSGDGERDELEVLRYEMRKKVSAARTNVAKTIGEDIARRRAAALRREESKEDPTLRYLRLKDIREHIEKKIDLRAINPHTKRPTNLMIALNAAFARGKGHDWLDALDDTTFEPLIDPQIVAEIRTEILDGTDPELAALSTLQEAHEYALNCIERGLESSSNEDGINLRAPEGVERHAPVLAGSGGAS